LNRQILVNNGIFRYDQLKVKDLDDLKLDKNAKKILPLILRANNENKIIVGNSAEKLNLYAPACHLDIETTISGTDSAQLFMIGALMCGISSDESKHIELIRDSFSYERKSWNLRLLPYETHDEVRSFEQWTMKKTEKQMIQHFLRRLRMNNIQTIYHWAPFEHREFMNRKKRYPDLDWGALFEANWVDLCAYSKSKQLAIPGALNYSIKSIGKSLYHLNHITECWDDHSDTSNGLDAATQAGEYYMTRQLTPQMIHTMKQIQTYNEKDVTVMFQIAQVLNSL
jgi:hypothetical protein